MLSRSSTANTSPAEAFGEAFGIGFALAGTLALDFGLAFSLALALACVRFFAMRSRSALVLLREPAVFEEWPDLRWLAVELQEQHARLLRAAARQDLRAERVA